MIAARQSADAAEVDNGGGVPKPQSPSPRDPRDIPALAWLASERCWCVWSWEWDEKRGEGKWTKPPRRPDGAFARNNDPTTWFSFEECWRQVMAGQADGIGFMMLGLAGGKLAAIDLDKVRDPDSGALLPWAERLVEEAGSYCEVTPSETGLRILGNAAGIGTMHRKIPHPEGGSFELYADCARFITISGHVNGHDQFADIAGPMRGLEALGGKKPNEHDGTEEAGEPIDLDSLPLPVVELVTRGTLDGKPVKNRGPAFARVVRALHAKGGFAAALATLQAHPNGVQDKFAGRLAKELRRIWDKIEASSPPAGLPEIQVRGGARHEAADAGIAALIAASVPIYQRSAELSYVIRFPARAADGRTVLVPGIMEVPSPLLLRELGKAAVWRKFDGRSQELVRIDPPGEVAAQIRAMANEWPFPPLLGVISTPTLRPDGSLLDRAGYDLATGLVLFEPPPMPPIPAEPSRADALAALAVINALLAEFPFSDDAAASRSVALSMQMTPVLRGATGPAVPLHIAKAPAGGTGKSYLADIASGIAVGEPCPVITVAPNAEETEKRLIGAALTGQAIISIDNCNGELRSQFLCQAIERPLLQIRALGSSDLARIGNSVTCFANGNNIEVAEDLIRRTLQCSLDANMEQPETRKFKGDPMKAVLANRGKYVAAILTVARAYIVADKPSKPSPFASFDRWSELVRGALIWLGQADPVQTVAQLHTVDPAGESRSAIFAEIAKLTGATTSGVTTGEVVGAAGKDENEALAGALKRIAGKDDTISPDRLGWWFRRNTNAFGSGYKLVRDSSTKTIRYRLSTVNSRNGDDDVPF